MPLDKQLFAAMGIDLPDQPTTGLDPEVMNFSQQFVDAMRQRRILVRDTHLGGLTSPLAGIRSAAAGRALKEVTSPRERQELIEDVREASEAIGFLRDKAYQEAEYAGRFGKRAQQVGGAFVDAGSSILGAASDFRNWMQGRGKTVDEIRFIRALETAKQGSDPSLGKDVPLSLRGAAGATGMAPDLSAGLLAGVTAGPYAMFAYWTARLFPERNEDYLEMGLSPEAAASAGAVTAAVESAIEMINIDPTGVTKGAIAQPMKGVARRGITQLIRKYGGKRLIGVMEKSPVLRGAIAQSLDALERIGVEVVEEGMQRGVRDVGQYLAAATDEGIEGPVFSSIAPAMWEEMKAAAPGIAALGGGAGGGMAFSEIATQQFEARQERIRREITDHSAQGRTPSRKIWKQWGLSEEIGKSQFQRKEHTRRLADEIAIEQQVREQAAVIREAPAEVTQEAGEIGRKVGVPITPAVKDAAVGAEGEVPAGKDVDPPKWGEVQPEVSAQVEAQEAAEAARPEAEGFLASEVGAKPLVGKLGEQERAGVLVSREPIDMSTGDKENDRRLRSVHGIKRPSFVKQLKETVGTTWRYVTRPQVNIPKTEKYAYAREFFRLSKAIPPAAVDESIRTVAAIIDPLNQEQSTLFENAILAQNMRRTIEKNATVPEEERESLRHGFTAERGKAWHDKIFGLVEANPGVQAALDMRGRIVRETVTKLVARGLMSEKALADPERYFHQQVNQVQEAKLITAGGARRQKKSFMMGRVTGVDLSAEEYDFNTSYIESEVEWLADAFAELRKAELLGGLMERYNRAEDLKDSANARGVPIEQVVHESPGLVSWQPQPGNVFYKAFSIPEKIGTGLQAGILAETKLTRDGVRQVVALGGTHKSVIIPVELADQLDAMEQSAQAHWLTELNRQAMNSWKAFILLNPKRIIGYNIRNFTGDMDPVLAADPRILKFMPRATQELLKYHHGRLALSPEMRLARDLGVVSAGFFSSEVAETSELAIFRRLMPVEQRKLMRNPAKLYMEIVRPHVEMRENVLRYAAFLTYFGQIEAGTLRHYGAAKRITVQTLAKEMGTAVAAAHMSRELLGDYGNMTEAGEWVRGHLYPFWAFQEINLKRYPRLVINAIQSGEGRGRLAGVVATASMMRIGGWYATMWTWNNVIYPMLFGSDDEDELSDYDSDSPHVLLGRNPDGTIRNFRNVGALGDHLEWYGINEAIGLVDEFRQGQATAGDVAWEMWKAPWEKMINLLRPDIKVGYELATGQSLFPDPFNPRSVRRDEAAAGAIGYEDEYKAMKGLIVGRGTRARPNSWQRWFVSVADPRKAALGEMYDLRARFLKSKGRPESGTYPVSEYKEVRDAASNEDYAAFAEWKEAFREKHGPDSITKFLRFLDRLDPISSRLNDEDEWEFEYEYLSSQQRAKLQMSRDYSADIRDLLVQWWIASEQVPPPGWKESS